MSLFITATNITSGPAFDVYIDDMGRPKIQASGSRFLSDEYSEDDIKISSDLRQAIVDDKIVLNLGSGNLTKIKSLNVLDGISILTEDITDGLFGSNFPSSTNVFTTMNDLGGSIITTNENDAIANASIPSSINPFATISDINNQTTSGQMFDVFVFGDSKKNVKNKFLKFSGTNHNSLDSSAIAFKNGEVIDVSLSTEQFPINNWFLKIIKNPVKGVIGEFSGGIQIGTDLEKTSGVLDILHSNLTGFNFLKGDKISTYVKSGTLGANEAVEPAVRIVVKYIPDVNDI